MSIVREDCRTEMKDWGVLEQCLKHVESYPDEEVDDDTLALSLDLISQSVFNINKYSLGGQ